MKLDLKKIDLSCVDCTLSVKDGGNLQAVVIIEKSFRFPQKKTRIFWLAERLLASHKRLCSMV
jgi:hypothetical protein